MIKIIDNSFSVGAKSLQDIPVKTVFKGKIGNIVGVFMQTFLGTVALADPNQTRALGASAYVYDYKEVDITIKVMDQGTLT